MNGTPVLGYNILTLTKRDNKMTQISNIFDKVQGSTIISIDTETVPTLRGGKKNPMKGHVTKITEGLNVMSFLNRKSNGYENMVNRRLKSEGKENFVLQPRKWGERVQDRPFVTHKGEYYMEVISLHSGKSRYELDGNSIEKSEIEGLPVSREGQQGGLDNKVIIRTFKLSSIRSIRIQGKELTGPFTY